MGEPTTTEHPTCCSAHMAALLLERNKRSIQRWCENGTLQVVHGDASKGQRLFVDLTQILDLFGPCSEPNFADLIVAADTADPQAQNDLGLVLLQEGKAQAAVMLFEEAARQDYPEAMHWLYQCHQKGLGVNKDENLAMMWLHKAAAHGHTIAKAQTQAIRGLAVQQLREDTPSPTV